MTAGHLMFGSTDSVALHAILTPYFSKINGNRSARVLGPRWRARRATASLSRSPSRWRRGGQLFGGGFQLRPQLLEGAVMVLMELQQFAQHRFPLGGARMPQFLSAGDQREQQPREVLEVPSRPS